MTHKSTLLVLACSAALFLHGCATMFGGYFDDVPLKNASPTLRITTNDGVEVPVLRDTVLVRKSVEVAEVHYIKSDSMVVSHFEMRPVREEVVHIRLRDNADHVLVLEDRGTRKIIQVYAKIEAWWLILDTVTGVLPVAVDAITGSWNSYDPIDAGITGGGR